ncbi:MAG: molybdopterin-dependent oxidoreductase [Candidatus Bathyarchaeota archaeon]|nr:molybdopterin-dependent oxidoreductase [Candidatus Bathyarchaeota archaeon]
MVEAMGEKDKIINISINGKVYSLEVNARWTLLQLIRDKIGKPNAEEHRRGLLGTPEGCCLGECGACTVIANGKAILACQTLAIAADGWKVTTIEAEDPFLRSIQDSFKEYTAFQCGVCTPGFIMSANALLDKNPSPTEDEVREVISGNFCRCGSYDRIIKAVMSASSSPLPEDVNKHYVGRLEPFMENMEGQGYSGLRHMGKRIPDANAEAIVTGKVNYTHNIKLHGMLHAKFVRSPYASAIIKNIESAINNFKSKNKKLSSRVRIFTGTSPEFANKFFIDEPLLAFNEVYYNGEPVAIVVAESIEDAEDAVYAINKELEYEERKRVVIDVEEAASEMPSEVVHEPKLITSPFEPERPNVINCLYVRSGSYTDTNNTDTVSEAIFNENAGVFVVEKEFDLHADPHAPIVHPNAVADYSNGSLTVWLDVQNISTMPYFAADFADVPSDKFILKGPQICAGGYGGKNVGFPGFYAAILTKAMKRPVRVMFNKQESMLHASRPWIKTKIKIGAKKKKSTNAETGESIENGEFTGIEVTFYNGGPYARLSKVILERAREAITCTYNWGPKDKEPNIMLTGYTSYTNHCNIMPYRGIGSLEAHFPMETAINMLAEKMKIDPLKLRLNNLVKEGEITALNEKVRSMGAEPCFKKIQQMMKDEWGPKTKVKEPWVVGRGFAAANKYSQGMMVENKIILKLKTYEKIDKKFEVEIIADSIDIGQGMNTISRQFVAEAFNIPIENVTKVEADTSKTPYTSNSFSSSATVDCGGAIISAANRAKDKLFRLAAPKLRVKTKDLETSDGLIRVKEAPNKSITWGDAIKPSSELEVEGSLNDRRKATPPGTSSQFPITGDDYVGPGSNDYLTGKALGPYYRLIRHMNYIASAVEVIINKETGELKLTKFIAGNDAIPVNPTLMEGQMIGGGLMAIANAMYEYPYHDKGRYLAKSLIDWKLPTILDLPKAGDFYTAITPIWGEFFGADWCRVSCPYGAKGVGEGTGAAAIPAMIDAIHDALKDHVKRPEDAWITETPATPDRILNILRKS